jgi:SAM-dependent methyltransferase
MRESAGEDFYASQYWDFFASFLPNSDSAPVVVDLGCGQGRLTFRFAERFGGAKVVGVDVAEAAVRDARIYAESHEFSGIEFTVADIKDFVYQLEPESVDIAVYTEVALFDPNWKEVLRQIHSRMRKGGLLISSFRSAYFNTLLVVSEGRLNDALQIVDGYDGYLWPSNPIRFSWTDSRELRQELEGLGLRVLGVTGIGCLSGIPGDPLDSVIQPGRITLEEQESLMKLELKMGALVPDAGRYVLAVARKD